MTTSEVKELDREQIMAMEAGPELDALVAERVMGWRFVDALESVVGSPDMASGNVQARLVYADPLAICRAALLTTIT